MTDTSASYPIGTFKVPPHIDAATRLEYVRQIADLPAQLRRAVASLSERQLDTPYREGGWTVRQVVHHLADSHANAYIRFKLALTEDSPTIRPYQEARWAELDDARTGPAGISVDLLDALHRRWVAAIETLPAEAFDRIFLHPELGPMPLNRQLAMYAWHGRHHLAHITQLATREGWETA